MTENNSIYRYADDNEQQKEPSVVPELERPIEKDLEEYKPPEIDRSQLSFEKTSKNNKGGE